MCWVAVPVPPPFLVPQRRTCSRQQHKQQHGHRCSSERASAPGRGHASVHSRTTCLKHEHERHTGICASANSACVLQLGVHVSPASMCAAVAKLICVGLLPESALQTLSDAARAFLCPGDVHCTCHGSALHIRRRCAASRTFYQRLQMHLHLGCAAMFRTMQPVLLPPQLVVRTSLAEHAQGEVAGLVWNFIRDPDSLENAAQEALPQPTAETAEQVAAQLTAASPLDFSSSQRTAHSRRQLSVALDACRVSKSVAAFKVCGLHVCTLLVHGRGRCSIVANAQSASNSRTCCTRWRPRRGISHLRACLSSSHSQDCVQACANVRACVRARARAHA